MRRSLALLLLFFSLPAFAQPSPSPAASASAAGSSSPSLRASPSASAAGSATAAATGSGPSTPSASSTPTRSGSPTPSLSAGASPSRSPSPTASATPTPTGSRAQAVCASAFGQTNYGVFPASGAQKFCTNVLPAQYAASALQLSRHQAAPGHRLTLTVDAWATEACCDKGAVYSAAAGAVVTTAASCALTGGAPLFSLFGGAPAPAPGSWSSNYGAQIGLCFFSDASVVASGITYTISTAPCPAGFFCPANAAAPIACAAGSYSAGGAAACASCAAAPGSYCPPRSTSPASALPCPAGAFCAGGAAANASCFPAAACPAAGLAAQPASFWRVATLAGSGAAGFADGAGAAAAFDNPRGVAVATSGDAFVADYNNARIRRVTPGGVVSTLAGSGTGGFADGTGTAALFQSPSAVAFSASGSVVVVADQSGQRIRLVTLGGVVTTLAGSSTGGFADGTGTNARFWGPHGVAVDGSGNVFVGDTFTHRVRRVTPGGVVTALAGSSSGYADGAGTNAMFNQPRGVAVDAGGNVFVADPWSNRLRKVTPGGVVSTFAGGAAGAVDGVGTAAALRYPLGVTVDALGNIVVADAGNNALRSVTPGGVVTTLAGSGGAGFADGFGADALLDGPTGVDSDARGQLFVADRDNNRIRLATCEPCPSSYYVASGGNTPAVCPAGSYCPYDAATLTCPAAPTPCPAGTYSTFAGYTLSTDSAYDYAAHLVDNLAGQSSIVFSVDAANDACVALMSGCAANGCPMWEIVLGAGGNTYASLRVASLGAALQEHSGVLLAAGEARTFWASWSGLSVAVGTGAAVGANQILAATRAAADPGGAAFSVTQLAVSTGWGATGKWYFPQGAGLPWTAGATGPSACAPCPAGTYSAAVGAASAAACVACAAGTHNPSVGGASAGACAPCAAGSFSAAGAAACAFTAASCPVGTFASGAAACAPCAPATACTVAGLSAQPPCYWNVSTFAGSGAAGWADGQGAAAVFNRPVGVAVDPLSLSVYVGDFGGHRVRRASPSGAVTTLAGSGAPALSDGLGTAADFWGLHGVAVDGRGNLYVGDALNHCIRKILPSGLVSTFAGNGTAGGADGLGTSALLSQPTHIALDASGAMGYIVEQAGSRIRAVALATAAVSALAGSGAAGFADGTGSSAQFDGPTSAAWHPSGALFETPTTTESAGSLSHLRLSPLLRVAGPRGAPMARGPRPRSQSAAASPLTPRFPRSTLRSRPGTASARWKCPPPS
jgi:sugar lactone lactonase YvrE